MENEARELATLSGDNLKKRIDQLSEMHAEEIIDNDKIILMKDYIDYAKATFSPSIVADINLKYKEADLNEYDIQENILNSNEVKATAKTNKKKFGRL